MGEDGILRIALQSFALTGLAIAAPILDVLGSNPTFFVAHDVDGWRLVAFAFVLAISPAICVTIVLVVIRLVSPPVGHVMIAGVMGALAALAVVPIIDHAARMSTFVFAMLTVAVATASALAYLRWRTVRQYTSWLALLPVLLIALFLFASPASALLSGVERVEAAVVRGSKSPVIVLVFDELPLGVLLDEHGAIDADRYPGFGRLADASTWYSKAVTVAPWTHLAVPAILTGQLPSDPVPVAATHPRSLFTMLAQSHRLRSTEPVTEICPTDLCKRRQDAESPDLASDTSILFLHSLLPDALEREWLPEIGERWAGFTDNAATAISKTSADTDKPTYDEFKLYELFRLVDQRDKQLDAFARFLTGVGPNAGRPGLWFQHTLLPHLPYQYLADGRSYDGVNLPALSAAETWSADPDLVANAAQRLAIQTRVVDQMLASLLERLETQGMLNDALIVVTADHGVTFDAGRGPRGAGPNGSTLPPSARNQNELLPVPLFVKYPGETAGRTDGRSAQTIDILPTVADSLGIDLPKAWHFDGRSLLGKRSGRRPLHYTEDTSATTAVDIQGPTDARQMAAYFQALLGPGGRDHDLYALEPYGALIGQRVDGIVSGGPVGSVTLDAPQSYANVDLGGVIPAMLQAAVTRLTQDDWIAVAVNGVVAGTGPVYLSDGTTQAIAMLDPTLLHAGANNITVYRIDGPSSLRPLTRT